MEKSNLINDDEHNKFVKLIENKCKVLSVTVARLYYAKSGRWELVDTGLVSLIKDNERRNYFLQLFNMDHYRKSQEFEIVFNSDYSKYQTQIHTVVSTNVQALLSFADCSESDKFYNEVTKIINQRKEQKEKKRMSQINNTNDGRMMYTNTAPVTNVNVPVQSKVDSKPNKKFENHPSSTGPRKLTKNDISNPSNFQHLDHMGLDTHFFTSENDVNLKKYLKGTPFANLLIDDNSRQDIYDIIEKGGGMSKLQTEVERSKNKERRAPAVPKTLPAAPQKQPPPPPPPSRPPPSVYVGPSNAIAKPIAPISGVPPPPPPPPPPPAPACPTVPKPSQNKPVPVAEEPRGGLLSEIVKFDTKKLKAQSNNPRPKEVNEPVAGSEGGSILESLAAFLADRQNLMKPNNSDDSNSESDEEDWKD